MNCNALVPNDEIRDAPIKNGDEALLSANAVASVGIAMLEMLETLLPAAAAEVERESKALADNFGTLNGYIEAQREVPETVRDAVSGVIVSMQFQDRNSQIMDNVAGMLERYRSMLEEIRTAGNADPTGHLVAVAVKDILSSIRLSDIRARYLEALIKAKMHESGDVLEMPQSQPDIELF